MTNEEYFDKNGVIALVLFFAVFSLFALIQWPGGEVNAFATASLEVSPFVLAAVLAYLADSGKIPKPLAALYVIALIAGIALISVFVGIMGVMPANLLTTGNINAIPDSVDTGKIIQSLEIILLSFLGFIIACLCYLRPLRRYLSRCIPIDPESFLHASGLAVVLSVVLILIIPVTVTGEPPFLSEIILSSVVSDPEFFSGTVGTDIYGLIWMTIGSFAAAGLFLKRDLKGVLKRIGLERPTVRQVLAALAAGAVLVLLFTALDDIVTAIWSFFGWNITDTDKFEFLLSPYLTIPGIIAASVSAGFGEEIAVRGVLQPRYGIILSAMFFAALHAFQYNWDGIITVFIAGILFGLLRTRYNTTFCAVTHSTYDFILFLLLMLGVSL
ncbi:CPBP family intramembrane glutamic endopeptidase [Methanoplanus limicola]|uniref:Abortive infection protein n=1 Tax=Methanoplanus limicola DSM 2279 TaxID=937775 RepID=H1Z168_9EURY|nr:CPBP family intramembrane glutamic endopeptidase [Methanoplanus limicola]EHQ35335.1 Abortive infection protein [Methanoplanus limicola DSM 2279]